MRRTTWFLAGGLAVALVLAFGVSRWASSQPDGLDRVTAEHGLVTAGQPRSAGGTLFADYSVGAISDRSLSTGVAGAAGVLVAFGLCWALLHLATPRTERA